MTVKISATRALREELKALLARHDFDLLVDDTLWLWRDDYTDSCLVYMRPTGWLERWRARHDATRWRPVAEVRGEFDDCVCPSHKDQDGNITVRSKEKADPVSEIDLDVPSRHQDGWEL